MNSFIKQFLINYVFGLSGLFAIVLVLCAFIGQIPNYLIYSTAAITINAAVLGLATQDYDR